MNHFASRAFWQCYSALPDDIRELADRNFALLQADPTHPSLHFKKVGRFRSARVGRHYRALAVEVDDGLLWFCENCNNKLHEAYFELKNIETDFLNHFNHYYDSEALRTCKECGEVMQKP